MDKLKYIFINICVPVALSVFVFISVYFKGFCLADPVYTLDSNTLQLLQGGNNSGLGAANYYGLNAQGYDPITMHYLGIGYDMSNGINNYLEQNYNMDLSDVGFAINDAIESGTWLEGTEQGMIYRLTDGAAASVGELVNQGLNFISSKALVGGMACKMFFTGAVDSVTGKITSILNNNAYVKLTDDYVNNINSAAQSIADSTNTENMSDLGIYYSKSLQTSWVENGYTYVAIINTSIPCFWCVDGSGIDSTYQYVFACFPSEYVGTISGTMKLIQNGTVLSTNTLSWGNWRQEVFNSSISGTSESYYKRAVGTNYNQPCSAFLPNYWDIMKPFLQNNDYGNKYVVVNYSNGQNLGDLLEQLKDKWVTTDDLRQINEKMNELTLGNISVDGQNNIAIDTSTDNLTDLASLIQDIIDRNSFLNNDVNFNEDSSLNEPIPNPDPEPIENVNQGIDIPTNLDSGLFDSVWNLLSTPFETMSVFSPIFAIFGSGAAIFSLWLFLPSFIIILLVIWALK